MVVNLLFWENYPAEGPEDSIFRHIVNQLIDQTALTQDEFLLFKYSEEDFDKLDMVPP